MMAKGTIEGDSKFYDEHYRLMKLQMGTIQERINPLPVRYDFMAKYIQNGKAVLDCGCRDGEFLLHLLSNRPGIAVSGVDISTAAIADCNANLTDFAGFKGAVCGPVEKMTFADGSFDVVTASELLEHLNEPEVAVREMLRVLKDLGLLIVTVPIGQNIVAVEHRHSFGWYEVLELFDKFGFEYKVYRYYKLWEKERPDIWVIVLRKGMNLSEDDGEVVNDE
jgi:ubiquinone/menaquinone biosynthesis C-methylase UbiE